jgi:hypothetical protein
MRVGAIGSVALSDIWRFGVDDGPEGKATGWISGKRQEKKFRREWIDCWYPR